MTEGRAARDGSEMHACPWCSRCRPTRSLKENYKENQRKIYKIWLIYMIYDLLFELNDCWPTERAYCIYVIFKVILCLYFSTLHSLFVLLQHALILILDLYFSFLHYWWGCKAKYIWCLLLYVSLIFNCYPLSFREVLFLLKC